MSRFDRRTFIRGAGVTLSLPILDAMRRSHAEEIGPKQSIQRMVLINLGFGLYAPNLFPTKSGFDYDSTPYLEILSEFRKNFTIISGVCHPDVDGGHLASKSFLTAAPKPASSNFKNTISLDQVAAEQIGLNTRYSSIALTTAVGRGLSYSRSGVEIPAESRPSQLFSKLFLDGRPAEKRQQVQRLKDGQSVMDAVLSEARLMQSRLGAGDRDKLDQYFTAVRATEQRLAKAQSWEDKPKPRVETKPPQDIHQTSDIIGRAQLMFDLMHLAIQTDSTRLLTFYNSGMNAVPPIQGVTQDYHNLSHHGRDPTRLAELAIIERAQLELLRQFLVKLRDSKEGNETLLEKTIVLFGSDLGDASSHDNRNLPIILAGGRFHHGQHLAFDRQSNYPLPNLFVSMLQQMGLEIEKFATSTGTMRGLES